VATATSRAGEAHRASQARLADALIKLVGRAYRGTMNPGDLSFPMFERWLLEMLPLVYEYRDRSAALSNAYLERIGLAPVRPDPLPSEAVRTSLIVTGWASLLERIEKGVDPAEAIEKAATQAEGAADRHALDGGRSITARTLQAQTRLAWYRVTRGACCSWCAMLSSRGAVYGEDSFADSDPRFIGDGTVKVHDHCHCTLAALETDEPEPELITQRRDLWERVTKGLSGDAAQNAFRRAYEENLRQAA
jgi:hypothetical protein